MLRTRWHCHVLNPASWLHLGASLCTSNWPSRPWPPDWPDDSPGLPSTCFMRTGKFQRSVPGWRTHRQTYAVALSFLQQALSSRDWFISSRKGADQRHLALFEDPALQCYSARQLSPEHIITDAYDWSWNWPWWPVKNSLLFRPDDYPACQSTIFMGKGLYTHKLFLGFLVLLALESVPQKDNSQNISRLHSLALEL